MLLLTWVGLTITFTKFSRVVDQIETPKEIEITKKKRKKKPVIIKWRQNRTSILAFTLSQNSKAMVHSKLHIFCLYYYTINWSFLEAFAPSMVTFIDKVQSFVRGRPRTEFSFVAFQQILVIRIWNPGPQTRKKVNGIWNQRL